MLRLRTLGGLTIEDQNGPVAGAIARRRSLALLALVGLGSEQGVSRDRVLAFLWPESDTDRARNNLKQTMFQLRQELHEDVFLRGPGALRLNPETISVDACDFQAALERSNLTTAVTLYRGPFLDGFYLPGLAEFERWAESERAVLAQRYTAALEGLANTAARHGDHHGACDWWRRLAATDRVNPRYAVGLMRALVQAGDRSAALDHARVYEELIRGEYDTAPDPEVVEYAKQLRGMFGRWAGAPPARPAGPRISPSPGGTPVPKEEAEPVVAGSAVAAPPNAPDSADRKRRRLPLVALGVALLVLAAVWWGNRSVPPTPVSPDLVAVFPFSFTGTGQLGFFGNGLADLLSASLDGAGELRSIHPSAYLARVASQDTEPLEPERARGWAGRLGAELYVLGDVVATNDRVHISAVMYQRGRNDPVGRSSVAGSTADLFPLVDRLAAELIASRYRQPHERLTRVAAVTTASLPAFKSYLDGEDAYREGRYAEAIEALTQAVTTDSTFALGYYRLSDAADRAGRAEEAQRSAEQALRYRDRLGERERRLIEVQHTWQLGHLEEAESLGRSLVADYPDDTDAWLQLAEVLVHGNPLRGRSSVEARPALEQVLVRDPDNGEALIHLARIAWIEGKRQEVDTLVRRVREVTRGAEVVESRALRAYALGDRPGQKRVTQQILAGPARVPPVTALEVAVLADDLDGTERFALWMVGAAQAPDLQGYGHRMLAQVAVARGQWRRASSELVLAARQDSIPALELQSLFAAFTFLPLPRRDIEEARDAVRRWTPADAPADRAGHTTAHVGVHRFLRLHRLGLLDIRLGDTTGAMANARALDRTADSSRTGRLAHTLAQSIRAHVAAAGGRPGEALSDLNAADWETAASIFVAEAYDRYVRAELLARIGRDDEALGWLRSIAERASYELVYLAPSQLRQAEIYDRRGNRDEAMKHYRRFIELWQNADPELQGQVEQARKRLVEMERER
ncbi:MAG: BTAD domain-containing putative transcriptional regulator [Gemmatimonadales bacterium]